MNDDYSCQPKPGRWSGRERPFQAEEKYVCRSEARESVEYFGELRGVQEGWTGIYNAERSLETRFRDLDHKNPCGMLNSSLCHEGTVKYH